MEPERTKASHMCVLGSVLGRLMARREDRFAGTVMRVDICTFDPRYWEGIVESIIWNLAQGGGAVSWELTDEGKLHLLLHKPGASNSCTGVREHKPVVVMCKLSGNESTRILKISAKIPNTDGFLVYGHMLGVTDDGLWFGSHRRYYDDVDHSGLELDELNVLAAEGEVNYKWCVVYDPDFFSESMTELGSVTTRAHSLVGTDAYC